ncbi:MAG: thiamine pyrophosphate-binding protein [Chloroflexota bacterium]|nr:thiamine pyrophosphate-binding protein [Chloroflexota bacterium]
MKVHQALADAFAAEGVTAVFTMMGDANMHWLADLHQAPGVSVYEVRHEGAGLSMADGWARASGGVGVCAVTCGPGLTQLATALLVAGRARTPLVVFAGDVPAGEESHLQYFDQHRFAEATEAGFVQVTSPESAQEALRTAFFRARLESRPILLDVPMDLQQLEYEQFGAYQPSSSRLPVQRLRPDKEQLRQAAELIRGSRKPVVLVGRGALLSGAVQEVRRLAERIGALMATTLLAKGTLAEDPYHAGIAGLFTTRTVIQLFAETDCVIAVGASLNNYTIENGYIFPSAKYVHIDTSRAVVMGSGQVADCYVQADAKAALEELLAALGEAGAPPTGFRTAEIREQLAHALEDPAEFEIEPGTMDPRQVAAALDRRLPYDVGLVIGGGHFFCFPAMGVVRPRRLVLTNPQFGAIGQGLPTAIGAAISAGGPLVLVEGDASTMMHIQELDTAVRYQLPLLVVVMNDQALGAEYHKLRASDLPPELAAINSPNIGSVAAAMGCRGSLATNIADLEAGLEEFLAQPRPTVIDARLSRSVVSIPYRRLHFGIDA